MPGMNRLAILLLPLALGLPLLLSGCGKSKNSKNPETAKVTGTVKYKGDPVEGAIVTFLPAASKDMMSQGKGNAAYGTTDKNGNYTLKTFSPGDGAVPGSYIVTVTKFEQKAVESTPDVDSADYNPPGENDAPPKPPKNDLPKKYEAIKTSDLKADVAAGTDNVVDLDLKD